MSQARMEEFDVLVIGSGFAGLAAAIEAAQLGVSVLVIEKKPLHGRQLENQRRWNRSA